MAKRLLYLEDLYDFYSTKYKRSTHFSSEKTGEPIVVQVHGKINFEEADKNKDGLLPVHLQACHTNLNINNSNIEESVMTSALPSFSNRPILGYIHKVVTDENPDGQWEFYGHNCHEENGELVYDEVPIGIIPESCNAQLIYDKDKDKTYCEVDGYIFEEYSKAAEILQREGECAVSVELSIRELSYDGKLKCLNIEDFWFSGVTILGKNEYGDTIKPGMTGSNIKLADFSADNNSLFAKYENKMIEFQERLEKLESTCSNIQLSKEGGNDKNMDKFNELLEKYGKTAEDIDFEYEDMTDEELESKFEEVFGKLEENSTSEPSNDEGIDDGDESEENPEVKEDNACGGSTKKKKKCEEDDPKEESDEDEPEVKEDNACGGGGSTKKKKKNNSVEPMIRTYEISHDDIRCALYNLLASYEESDNDWYFITGVYDSYFVYESWNGGKIYGQKYTKDNDNVAFDGERYSLHKEYLTDSEYAELQSMRSNYSSIVEELNTYKSAEVYADKMTVFDDEAYADYLETDEFKSLMSDESINQYSKEELAEKADATLGKLVKKNRAFSYSENNEKKSNKVNFNLKPDVQKKSKAYGTLFK